MTAAAATASSGQLKALERLAEYPQRVAKLKALWIDVQGGPSPRNASRSRSPSVDHRRSSPSAATASSRPARPKAAPQPGPKRAARPAGGGSPGPERGRSRGASPGSARARQGRPAQGRGPEPAQQGPLTAAQIRDLMNRDLTPEDYELLLLLDQGVKKAKNTLSEESAAFLPKATGTAWIDEACSICLCALEEDEDVRLLPSCGHIFHAPCAQRWLTSQKASCPLCGQEEKKQDKVMGVFRRFDSNGDGLISLADLKSVLKALDTDFWTAERVERLFASADSKQDGSVDMEEFVNWVFAGGGVPDPPELERCVTRDRLREAVEV